MTHLLVSVRSAEEARAALAGGAAIVDVKEPLRGALGSASADVLRAVQAEVAGRCPLSAALGELLNELPGGSSNAFHDRRREGDRAGRETRQSSLSGYAFAKLGLAGCLRSGGNGKAGDWRNLWRQRLQELPTGVAPIAVAYADWKAAAAPPPHEVLQTGATLGCAGLLIDTHDKGPGDLFHWLSDRDILSVIAAAHTSGMFAALAGSLTLQSIERAVGTGADVIAVRGAACRDGRTGAVDADRVRDLASQVKRRARQLPGIPHKMLDFALRGFDTWAFM